MDITSTTPLTFQGDASRTERCVLSSGELAFRKTGHPTTIIREAEQLANLMNSSRIVHTPGLLASGDGWLMTTWLEGTNLAEQFAVAPNPSDRYAICERFGSILCASTAISSRIPEVESNMDVVFDTLERVVYASEGRVISDSDSFIDGYKVDDIWTELSSDAASIVPEIRYCQGDWCLPNLITAIVNAGELGAIVDWSEACWMDWRLCIADGLWSIGFNSRLAGVVPSDHQQSFLTACDFKMDTHEIVWHRKLRALMSLI